MTLAEIENLMNESASWLSRLMLMEQPPPREQIIEAVKVFAYYERMALRLARSSDGGQEAA